MVVKTIVLIPCVKEKLNKKAKARDLYIAPLFTYCLEYARKLNPDKIYILSALHKLLDLEKEIKPYDVTLTYLSPAKRKRNPGTKVLTKTEIKKWGEEVVNQLSQVTDLNKDKFIILAGESYIKPIKPFLKKIETPLKGMTLSQRIKYLRS